MMIIKYALGPNNSLKLVVILHYYYYYYYYCHLVMVAFNAILKLLV